MKPAAASDYRALAQRRLPHFLFEYIDGGAYTEQTLRANTADLQQVALRQRVLRDVSKLDTTTTLFGQPLSLPVILGPVGLAGMIARRGEVQAAQAAAAAGVPLCLSTVSLCSLAEVANAVRSPPWFQLYVPRDRACLRHLLDHATAAGSPVLFVTVDLPVTGTRYRDVRAGSTGGTATQRRLRRAVQVLARPRWAWDVAIRGQPLQLGNIAAMLGRTAGLDDFFAWLGDNFDPSVTWDDLAFLRSQWPGPIVLKGILDVEDARHAAALGIEGIVVSNHGGRQLDGVPSVARALPAIAAAVGDQLTVLADGGVRSGLDVLRMLALGAKGVLLGRAWVYALAGGGQAGVAHLLQLIEAELRVAMALTGTTRISDLDASCLVT